MMSWNSWIFSNPNSNLMESLILIHDYLSLILGSIIIFVLLCMVYTFFYRGFNLYFLDEETLEVVWTVFPFLIVGSILLPSLSALYMMDSCNLCGWNLIIMGHQWYWNYSYKETVDPLIFDSYMLPIESSNIRLLDVDNRLVAPTGIPVRCVLSSSDVLHSWTIPSLGVKMDAIPGRLNQFCFSPKRAGIFFGQCSEICGANHSFMPIVLESGVLSDL